MLKSAVLAALFATSCAANAAHQTWDFSFTGFLNESSSLFEADYQWKGSFSGSDGNHDGVIDKSEILSLVINDVDYVACAGDSNGYYLCGTDAFSYQLGGALSFSAGIASSDPEGHVSAGHVFTVGDSEVDYVSTPFFYSRTAYLWSQDTQFRISPAISGGAVSPIPEPGTWTMLLTGLGALALLRRRNEDRLG